MVGSGCEIWPTLYHEEIHYDLFFPCFGCLLTCRMLQQALAACPGGSGKRLYQQGIDLGKLLVGLSPRFGHSPAWGSVSILWLNRLIKGATGRVGCFGVQKHETLIQQAATRLRCGLPL